MPLPVNELQSSGVGSSDASAAAAGLSLLHAPVLSEASSVAATTHAAKILKCRPAAGIDAMRES